VNAERVSRASARLNTPLGLWLPVALYMAAIFVVSGMSRPPMPEGVSDVSLHAAAYFGLALLIVRALAHGTWNGVTAFALAGAWVIAVLYGATDEWHQSFVTGRSAEWRDLWADATGALAGVITAGACGIIRRL
jgi:VanZ family protein